MKPTLRKVLDALLILDISAALWQLPLFPLGPTISAMLPFSVGQNLLAFALLVAVIALVNWYGTKQGYLDWKTFRVDKTVGRWLLFGILAKVGFHVLAIWVGQLEGVPYLQVNNDPVGYYLVIDVLTSVILAPIAEEVVFRKLLPQLIFPKRLGLGLTISGILFALIHLPVTLGDWVSQLGAALILSLVYDKTRRVEASILVHLFMNFFLTVIFWWFMYS